MKTQFRVAACLFLTALLVAPAFALRTGDAAPPFTCASLEGKPVSSADLSGKVAVIAFWASWCKYCREELKQLQALEQELGPKGLVVLAINEREDPHQVAEFLQHADVKLRVLLDDGRAGSAFGVNGLPDLLILDRDGTIRDRLIGYGPGDPARLRRTVLPLLAEAKRSGERPRSLAAPSDLPATLRAYAHLQIGAAHINIGDAFTNAGFRDAGHYAEAVKEMRAGLALDPKNVDLNVWLGVALERTGDKTGAVKQYRAALALDPTNVYAVEGLRRLTQTPPTTPPAPEAPGEDR